MNRENLSLAGGSFTVSAAGETLWYLTGGTKLLYLGFAPPQSSGVRLPAALRHLLAGTEPRSLPPAEAPELKRQLEEYFSGRRRSFSTPLELPGTPFQQLIWRTLLSLPYGSTRSYAELAAAAGAPDAVRAAAGAVASNPVVIIVPCHRIVPASGGIGNYGSGPERKRKLLTIEDAEVVRGS
jgi:O-6-methylguanine DNA methyltransferase